MPRGQRILLENVCYHVINRGNQSRCIFLEDADFENYLQLLKHYKRKHSFKLFGYCLMPTHIHLILEPKAPLDLPKLMQAITQTYTRWFNKKYKTNGHLWQSRFKSMIIQRDDYFLDCINYVEANPVRAKLAGSPSDYPWSSFNDRSFGNKHGLLSWPDST